MSWHRTAPGGQPPADPVGEAVAAAVAEILRGAKVELRYSPADDGPPTYPTGEKASACAVGPGPAGWNLTWTVTLSPRMARSVTADSPLVEIVRALPPAAVRAAERFRPVQSVETPATPALRRALRDTLVIEALSGDHGLAADVAVNPDLVAETLEFLVELGGIRVESHDLTHGVVITDALADTPRLRFVYPRDLRAAKRAPLLFDGERSVLVVDRDGLARTELQRHRLGVLTPGEPETFLEAAAYAHSGQLVAEATRRLGGIGFFLRGDRTIWVFGRGRPLLMRRAEHWSAFPLELGTAIAEAIGGSASAAELIVQTAFIISGDRHGAILAVVDEAGALDGIVSPKDRYDLRNDADPMAMQTETRLHHLIDANDLDAPTLARLASLDGATILDRAGNLLAYGAIVTSADSAHEGARTAAARTLSLTADIVLKVSVDGDITVFRNAEVVATLLG